MSEPEVGARYLTPSGVPVQAVEVENGLVIVQSLASENRFAVPLAYPLRPLNGEAPVYPVKETPNRPFGGPESQGPALKKQSLAPLIDAMLLAGNMTMRGIVRELRRKASAACHGRDLHANIRARIHWLRKRGMKLHRDVGGRVHLQGDIATVGSAVPICDEYGIFD